MLQGYIKRHFNSNTFLITDLSEEGNKLKAGAWLTQITTKDGFIFLLLRLRIVAVGRSEGEASLRLCEYSHRKFIAATLFSSRCEVVHPNKQNVIV
jgi:hypothetical protein